MPNSWPGADFTMAFTVRNSSKLQQFSNKISCFALHLCNPAADRSVCKAASANRSWCGTQCAMMTTRLVANAITGIARAHLPGALTETVINNYDIGRCWHWSILRNASADTMAVLPLLMVPSCWAGGAGGQWHRRRSCCCLGFVRLDSSHPSKRCKQNHQNLLRGFMA